MKKSIYTLFLLILCFCSFFSGKNVASAENNAQNYNAFRLIRQATADGQISLTYVFPINSSKLSEIGFQENEIQAYKFYLTTYVNALAQTNREKATEGTTIGNCVYFEDVDGIGFSILFEDLDAQKLFFGVQDGESTSNSQKASGFFVKRVEIETSFPISAKSANDLKLICTMATTAWCANNDISSELKTQALNVFNDTIFVYDFAAQTQGLKSDVMYQDDYFFHNVFVKTAAQIEENDKITFWVTYANRPIWYLTPLVVVLLGIGISFAVLNFKKKHKS